MEESVVRVRVFGYSGKVKDAIENLLKDSLESLNPCKEHYDCS